MELKVASTLTGITPSVMDGVLTFSVLLYGNQDTLLINRAHPRNYTNDVSLSLSLISFNTLCGHFSIFLFSTSMIPAGDRAASSSSSYSHIPGALGGGTRYHAGPFADRQQTTNGQIYLFTPRRIVLSFVSSQCFPFLLVRVVYLIWIRFFTDYAAFSSIPYFPFWCLYRIRLYTF